MAQLERIALVTGANKGIGREIARQLAEAGVTVLLGARDPARGQSAAAEIAGATFLPLDVTKTDSIAAAADTIAVEHGRLDVLVNNAAIFSAEDGTPARACIAAVRQTIETNFLGALAVTQAMLPLLHRSAGGRIVNLSSPLGSLAVAGDPSSPFNAYRLVGYNSSKAALNLLTLQLAADLAWSSVTVNAVVPGFVQTDLTDGQGTMSPAEGARLPVHYALTAEPVSGRFDSPEGPVSW
ncbi:SDR family NAD(P)-dependent oxidoreductase [Croceibacterium sp. TMG7-5b_MA50]|uniref:SDR family NAD(P)-dependent oxidoreductase n=1 Tax=Croceibacterium sp. TMG7-5b_MA50 TaxID=3121290 RepID=UPI0032216C04